MAATSTVPSKSPYNGDGVRTSKTAAGHTTEYVLDVAATVPAVATP